MRRNLVLLGHRTPPSGLQQSPYSGPNRSLRPEIGFQGTVRPGKALGGVSFPAANNPIMERLLTMPDLADLEALIARLATTDFSQTSEQATREMVVNPIIGALGWDTFSPGEVAREHPVRDGKVDYCLRGPRGPLVLIEVKRTGTALADHQEQLLGYAFREGVPLAALTDGLIWWLYLPTATASWEQRRFCCIDFREQNAAQAASALHRFTSREGPWSVRS